MAHAGGPAESKRNGNPSKVTTIVSKASRGDAVVRTATASTKRGETVARRSRKGAAKDCNCACPTSAALIQEARPNPWWGCAGGLPQFLGRQRDAGHALRGDLRLRHRPVVRALRRGGCQRPHTVLNRLRHLCRPRLRHRGRPCVPTQETPRQVSARAGGRRAVGAGERGHAVVCAGGVGRLRLKGRSRNIEVARHRRRPRSSS
jgi:hypothetical protein